MKKVIISLLFICSFLGASAQKNDSIARPKLVVTIAIDGLRSDYIGLVWKNLQMNGLRRLITNGAYCKNVGFNYMTNANVADYVSVFTGTIPADHGIVGRSYFDRETKKEQSFLFDKTVTAINGIEQFSPRNILSTTFIDELYVNTGGKSKVITVAMNAAEAMAMAGHVGGTTVWMENQNCKWATSSYYGYLPIWAQQMNNENVAETAMSRPWNNLYLSNYYHAMSAQTGISSYFSYSIADPKSKIYYYEKFKETPFVNNMVRSLAMRAIMSEYIGIDDVPDVVNLQFSVRGIDQASNGMLTAEVQDLYYRLDMELQLLVEDMDARFGKSNVLYVIYTPQTEYSSPERMKANRLPAGYFSIPRSMSLLSTYLMALYGQADYVVGFANRQVYLNHEEIKRKNLKLSDVIATVTEFMTRFEGVQSASSVNEMLSGNCQTERILKAKNAFNPQYAGDVMVFLEPGWVDIFKDTEKIGVSSRGNQMAPLIFSGWKVNPQEIKTKVSVVDIAPTVCKMLQISAPNATVGEIIPGIAD